MNTKANPVLFSHQKIFPAILRAEFSRYLQQLKLMANFPLAAVRTRTDFCYF